MILKIDNVKKDFGADNKGSCVNLIDYYHKENELKIPENIRYMFSHFENQVQRNDALKAIDDNKGKLKTKDKKFFSLTINPNENEQKHLIKLATGKDVVSVNQLDPDEIKAVESLYRSYTRDVMDIYAQQFNREKVKSGADLVYFGMMETERRYKREDVAVKSGEVKVGDIKPGLNFHVHVIVSRNDATKTVSLTPNTKWKRQEGTLNGNKYKSGFYFSEWVLLSGQKFNDKFDFRQLSPEYIKLFKIYMQQPDSTKNLKIQKENFESLKREKAVKKASHIASTVFNNITNEAKELEGLRLVFDTGVDVAAAANLTLKDFEK